MSAVEDASGPRYVDEPLVDGLTQRWRVDRVVHAGRTEFQDVVIGDTHQGRALFCDGDPQSSADTQQLYHEALLVPALLLAGRVGRVLAVGSSEGVVPQLAVAAGAREVDHVDIDREVVRLCARHLPYGYTPDELAAAEAGDGPVRMHYADGLEFVRSRAARRQAGAGTGGQGAEGYDVVVLDLPAEPDPSIRRDGGAPHAPHSPLLAESFLARCRSLLRPGGVVATQAGCPTAWLQRPLRAARDRFAAVFPTVAYHGSDEFGWAFLFGTAAPVADPTARMIENLPALGFRPATLDAAALVAGSVPPHGLRHQRG